MFKKIAIAVSLVLALSIPALAQPPHQQNEAESGGSAYVHMDQTAPGQLIVPIQGSLGISTNDTLSITKSTKIDLDTITVIKKSEIEASYFNKSSDFDAGYISADKNQCFFCSGSSFDAGYVSYDKDMTAARFEAEKFSMFKKVDFDYEKTFELTHTKTFELNVLGQVGIVGVSAGEQEMCAGAKGGAELEGRHMHDVASGQLGIFAAKQGYDYQGSYNQNLSVPTSGGGAITMGQAAAWSGSAYQAAIGGSAAVNVAW